MCKLPAASSTHFPSCMGVHALLRLRLPALRCAAVRCTAGREGLRAVGRLPTLLNLLSAAADRCLHAARSPSRGLHGPAF